MGNKAFDDIWERLARESHEKVRSQCCSHLLARRPLIEKIEAILERDGSVMPRALEVGCGTAFVLQDLSRRHPGTFVGLDLSLNGIAFASSWCRTTGGRASFVAGDAVRLPFRDASIDLVFSQGVMEHFRDAQPFLAEHARVLKPGAYAIIDVPQTFNPYTLYKRPRVRRGTWEYGWETNYTYGQLKRLGIPFGLITIDRAGYGFERGRDFGFSIFREFFDRVRMQRHIPFLRPIGAWGAPRWDRFWRVVEKRIGHWILASVAVVYQKSVSS